MIYPDVLARNLRQLMKEKGVSQQKVAADLHIGQATISRYLKGKGRPNKNIVMSLAVYFDVHVIWLARGEGSRELIWQDPLDPNGYAPPSKSPRRDTISDSRIPKAGPGGDRVPAAPEWRPRPEDPLADTVRKLVDELTEQLRINRTLHEENENLRRRLHQVEGVVVGDHPPPTGERRRCVLEITNLLSPEPTKGNSGGGP